MLFSGIVCSQFEVSACSQDVFRHSIVSFEDCINLVHHFPSTKRTHFILKQALFSSFSYSPAYLEEHIVLWTIAVLLELATPPELFNMEHNCQRRHESLCVSNASYHRHCGHFYSLWRHPNLTFTPWNSHIRKCGGFIRTTACTALTLCTSAHATSCGNAACLFAIILGHGVFSQDHSAKCSAWLSLTAFRP